jgi:hypothetical protein
MDDDLCVCEHERRHHFVLGCTKCDCTYFTTWEEIDAEREAEKVRNEEKNGRESKSPRTL